MLIGSGISDGFVSFTGLDKASIFVGIFFSKHNRTRIDKHGSQGRFHDIFTDFIETQKGSHAFADLLHGLLVVVFQPVKDAVDKFLDSGADRIKEKYNRQNKNQREYR